jgi:hypothetical protein
MLVAAALGQVTEAYLREGSAQSLFAAKSALAGALAKSKNSFDTTEEYRLAGTPRFFFCFFFFVASPTAFIFLFFFRYDAKASRSPALPLGEHVWHISLNLGTDTEAYSNRSPECLLHSLIYIHIHIYIYIYTHTHTHTHSMAYR